METILSYRKSFNSFIDKTSIRIEEIEFYEKTMSLNTILATIVALEHFYIFYLESIVTQSDATSRVFNMNKYISTTICHLIV